MQLLAKAGDDISHNEVVLTTNPVTPAALHTSRVTPMTPRTPTLSERGQGPR